MSATVADAGDEGSFGNRFDDADGAFPVLYASSQRLGAFLETLARFRPDPHVLAASIAEDEADAPYPTSPSGRVARQWAAQRAISQATLVGEFVELGHSSTLAYLRQAMAPRVVHYGLDDLDAATIRLGVPRRFTQEISTHLYGLADEDGNRRLTGSPTTRDWVTRSTTGRSGSRQPDYSRGTKQHC